MHRPHALAGLAAGAAHAFAASAAEPARFSLDDFTRIANVTARCSPAARSPSGMLQIVSSPDPSHVQPGVLPTGS